MKIAQYNNRIGFWKRRKGSRPGEFVPLTNFGLQLEKFVKPPPSRAEVKDLKGYIVRVSQATETRSGLHEVKEG